MWCRQAHIPLTSSLHVSHAMWPTVHGTRVQHTAMCLMPRGPLSTVHVYSTLPRVSCHVAHCPRYTCTAHCHVSHAMWPTVYGTRVQHTAMCHMPRGPLSTVHVYSTLPCWSHAMWPTVHSTCTAHCHADHMSTHQFVCRHVCILPATGLSVSSNISCLVFHFQGVVARS